MTRSLVVLITLAVVAGTGWPASARAETPEAAVDARDRVDAAIRAMVLARFGAQASVAVDLLEVSALPAAGPLEAVADADSRLGRPLRFVLLASDGSRTPARRRVGTARASVHVATTHVRARRTMARGTRVEIGDVETVVGDVSGVLLRRLPDAAEVVGGRLLRDVAAREIVQTSVVVLTPAVRSGDEVTARARVGGAEVTGRVVAAQNGRAGAVIRVLNPESRRELRARVVRKGLVEVTDGL